LDVVAASYAKADSSGKLRITRVSGAVRVYEWDSGQSRWEYGGSTTGRLMASSQTGDVYFHIYFEERANSDLNANVDNFAINSGVVSPR